MTKSNLPQITGAPTTRVSTPSKILALFHSELPSMQAEFNKCLNALKSRTETAYSLQNSAIIVEAASAHSIAEIQRRTSVKSRNTVVKCLKRFLGLEDLDTKIMAVTELVGETEPKSESETELMSALEQKSESESQVRGFAAISREKARSGRPTIMDVNKVMRLNAFIRNGTDGTAQQLEKTGHSDKEHIEKLKAIKVWTHELLAKSIGVSGETVRRYCKKTKLQINAQGSHCFSKDLNYENKAIEVHTTYTEEQGHRTKVLCLDEKTCIQALAFVRYRIYNGEMYKSCRYTRLGCVHLIAAFDQRTGHVYHDFLEVKNKYGIRAFIENLPAKHPELRGCFIKFILDNLSAHKNFGESWYASHPNYDFIFTPTCASWLNQVESFFGQLTRYVLAGRSINSRDQLATDIANFIDFYNRRLKKPFKWDFNIAHHLDQRVLDLASFAELGIDNVTDAYVAAYRRLVGLHDKDGALQEIYLGVLQEEAKRPPMEVLV